MEKRLREVLDNQPENYILPFFWQHGENRELLEEGMEKIHASGIGAVCVESRPHPDFLGVKWWQDLTVIMEKAKALGMKVWVLDDAHFPSGFCNGRVGEGSPYGKTYLAHYTIDAAGPMRHNAFMVRLEPGERLIGVTFGRRDRGRSFYQTELREVTELVRDGKLYLDIPEGIWAVTVIKTTLRGTGRKGYINPLDREAVDFFIETVYEAHYAHFGTDFGDTFAGFFSDEPEIGNCLGEYKHDSYIGQPDMKLPWSRELEERLRAQWGGDFVRNLLAMWINVDGAGTAERCNPAADDCEVRECVPAGIAGQEGVVAGICEAQECTSAVGTVGVTVADNCAVQERTSAVGTVQDTAADNCEAQERTSAVGTVGVTASGKWAVQEKVLEGFAATCDSIACNGEGQDDNTAYNRTGLLRRQFMEHVADLYDSCFCGQIGDWCRAHGVEYIGHVIEDGGTHSHLGLGTGHFFKALWGQDMSGIDVVLQQIRPQLDDFPFYSIGGTGFYHGEFFHYGLAKMGVSLGHLDPKKRGRTMCEVFGAYGWAEGLKLMKWLLDHMLVRGVNHFVPHAFTMKEFPDPDCPPHFYARGRNPQYPYFRYLMEYANRVSHLVNGGRHVPVAALLYTAEQEWMGGVRKFEKDARELTRGQIDFEVVPEELLLKEELADGRLPVGQESVAALVVPGSEYISEALAAKCGQLAKKGFPVLFTERLPWVVTDSGRLKKLQQYAEHVCLTDGDRLADLLRQKGCYEIKCSEYQPWLRYYHYVQPEGEYYLFFTENVCSGLETYLTLPPYEGEEWWYDPWRNRLSRADREGDRRLCLRLSPYELKILYRGSVDRERYGSLIDEWSGTEFTRRLELGGGIWKLETLASGSTDWEQEAAVSGNVACEQEAAVSGNAACEQEAAVSGNAACEQEAVVAGGVKRETQVLGDLTVHGRKPYFSGTMRYRAGFSWSKKVKGNGKEQVVLLDLGEVYESAQVFINGKEAGVRVAPPYWFDISKLVVQGSNSIEVLVANTLAASQRDLMSMTLPLEPAGLLGPVALLAEAEGTVVQE